MIGQRTQTNLSAIACPRLLVSEEGIGVNRWLGILNYRKIRRKFFFWHFCSPIPLLYHCVLWTPVGHDATDASGHVCACIQRRCSILWAVIQHFRSGDNSPEDWRRYPLLLGWCKNNGRFHTSFASAEIRLWRRFFKHTNVLLLEKCFRNKVDVQNAFDDLVASRTPGFCAASITKMVSRWQVLDPFVVISTESCTSR